MIGSIGWPDIVIVAILAFTTLKGFSRGFLSEVGGAAAVLLAVAVPFYYNGFFDIFFENTLKMDVVSAHITGLVATGILVYCIVMALFWIVARFARLPVLGAGNTLGGGLVGFAKGIIFLWIVLFVALLFPLSTEVRADLHRSRLVAILAVQSRRVDAAIYGKLPDFAKPFVKAYLEQRQL